MSESSSLAAIVLCAGKGTRMRSDKAKVLHPLLGRPLCWYPISRALEIGASPVVAVVGHQAEAVTSAIGAAFPNRPISFAIQAEQKGTAHAVGCARPQLEDAKGPLLILYGDVPLLRAETLKALVAAYERSTAKLAMVTTFPKDPSGYGRVVRVDGKVSRVVEDRDATPEQKRIGECNAGIYVVDARFLWSALSRIGSVNAQGEFYLTDVVQRAAAEGEVGVVVAEFDETAGVNDRAELADRAAVLRRRINLEHMHRGVTFLSPETAWIEEGVSIGPDSVVEPMVSIGAGSTLGSEVRIGQGSVLTRTSVADGTEIKPYSVLEDAVVGRGCVIGPFARLRPGTVLEQDVHVGNFVELKKTHVKRGSKANHLAYLGDAEIGERVNVGAGTITCNYDGVNKHQTVLGDGVFIGSDTQLVAPVKVGDGAYVGAGTTVTQDVPPRSLALSRAPQVIKEGWVEKRKAKGK